MDSSEERTLVSQSGREPRPEAVGGSKPPHVRSSKLSTSWEPPPEKRHADMFAPPEEAPRSYPLHDEDVQDW